VCVSGPEHGRVLVRSIWRADIELNNWEHEKLMEMAKKRNPHKRLTTPEDVARCIVALCHPATYWMTGNTLRVDGGESIVG
jgi:NAD(P)-dependent dehydrogenase (short-subunit alcohol dehydrogenase family)